MSRERENIKLRYRDVRVVARYEVFTIPAMHIHVYADRRDPRHWEITQFYRGERILHTDSLQCDSPLSALRWLAHELNWKVTIEDQIGNEHDLDKIPSPLEALFSEMQSGVDRLAKNKPYPGGGS